MKYTRRHAAAVALCELVPLPVLDTWLQNRVRRRLIRVLGSPLSDDALRTLADEDLLPWDRIRLWPLKKLASKVLPFWTALEMARAYRDTLVLAEQLR